MKYLYPLAKKYGLNPTRWPDDACREAALHFYTENKWRLEDQLLRMIDRPGFRSRILKYLKLTDGMDTNVIVLGALLYENLVRDPALLNTYGAVIESNYVAWQAEEAGVTVALPAPAPASGSGGQMS